LSCAVKSSRIRAPNGLKVHPPGFLWAALSVCRLLLAAGLAEACTTPVFQYALIEWEADPYVVIIFHRGPLSNEEQAVIDRLDESLTDVDRPANLCVQTVNMAAEPAEELVRLYQAQPVGELPWMVVMYPRSPLGAPAVWSGRFSAAAARKLVDSPARREIARRILGGDSAVWVLVECGRSQTDEAAARLLEAHLEKLERTPVAPSFEYDGGTTADDWPALAPVQPSFSVLRISRRDAAEEMLLAMLLASEPDLAEYAEQPIVFPIFGRGRILYALVGAGINERNIEDACMFLSGPCSCEFKAQSPGTDILMAADWSSAPDDAVLDDIPPLTGVLPLAERTRAEHDAAEQVEAPPASPPREEKGTDLVRNVVLTLAGAVVLVAVATMLARRFGRSQTR